MREQGEMVASFLGNMFAHKYVQFIYFFFFFGCCVFFSVLI